MSKLKGQKKQYIVHTEITTPIRYYKKISCGRVVTVDTLAEATRLTFEQAWDRVDRLHNPERECWGMSHIDELRDDELQEE